MEFSKNPDSITGCLKQGHTTRDPNYECTWDHQEINQWPHDKFYRFPGDCGDGRFKPAPAPMYNLFATSRAFRFIAPESLLKISTSSGLSVTKSGCQ